MLSVGAAPRRAFGRACFVSQGVIQNFKPYDTAKLVNPQTVQTTGADGKTTTQTVTDQVIAQRPGRLAGSYQEFGTNGGGFFNANSAHPFENPTPLRILSRSSDFSDSRRPHLHAWPHDGFPEARLGRLGGDGTAVFCGRHCCLLGRSAGIRCCMALTRRPAPRNPAETWKARKFGSGSRIPRSTRRSRRDASCGAVNCDA